MRLLRIPLLALALGALPASVALVPADARASVSIAVGYDALVGDADVVAVVVPLEHTSVWEDGRIYTYTKVRIEQGVAGDLGAGAEGWVRTMGGVVGKVGQLVDGEPVFVPQKPSLLFLRRFRQQATFEVSARSQGQYPIVVDEATKTRKVVRSANVGVLLPPKAKSRVAEAAGGAAPQSTATRPDVDAQPKVRLAGEVLHDRPLDEVAREIAATWRRLHPTPPAK